MSYGHFDDEQKEYVITRPDTPLPWINYLGTSDFYGIISNTAGGYCFYQDARMRRLTRYRYNNIPMDSNGRYLYIKDGDTVWNPMWKPMRVALDKYECRHGLGYTKITGEKNGLEVSTLFFVPLDARNEIWHARITNHSAKAKKIRVWSFVEWCLWEANDDMTNFQRNYSTGQVEIDKGTIFHITEYRERRNHYGYFACSEPVTGFDSSRDAFVGVHQGLDAPQAILQGACKNSVAYGWLPIGVHQIDIDLKPGESKTVNFLLGYGENPQEKKFLEGGKIRKDEFEAVRAKYAAAGAIDAAFDAFKASWGELLVAIPRRLPGCHRQPDGQYLEPVSMHGDLQSLPLGIAVRIRDRQGDGIPRQQPGHSGIRPHSSGPRTAANPRPGGDATVGRDLLSPISTADKEREHGCRRRI